MSQDPQPMNPEQKLISASDIKRAASEGVRTDNDAEALVKWAYQQYFNRRLLPEPTAASPEQRKGFNLVTVLYYFGALLMISACAWFLGDKWDVLGPSGVCITVIIYMAGLGSLGVWLRRRGFLVGGGLLITVAVCLTPLATYTIEKMTGIWPAQDPGSYSAFFPMIHASWILMEVATIGVALIALLFVRFSFLTAPMAYCAWFLSMDLAALIYRQNVLDHERRDWLSIAVGLATMIVGYLLQRILRKRGAPSTEDFAFWAYLFGLLAFWFGLTALGEFTGSEAKRFIYFVINLGLMGLAIRMKRATFMVFGVVGVYIYLGHMAWEVFKNSPLFPFVVAAMGLSIILLTVLGQKWLRKPEGHPPASPQIT